MSEVISVRALRKTFGSFLAVDDVSFSVRAGEVYGFLGPNGSGKSTTIRMILSLIRPDSGTVRLFGQDPVLDYRSVMSRIGCIVEKPDFYRYLTAKQNLWVLSRYSGMSISRRKVDEMLELVGLSGRGNDQVKGYSHGMRQRLGLAQALLHNPDLIILDEPTTGLDPQGIIDIRNLILHLSRDLGKTVFLSSHILHELELVADKLLILNKGKVVLEGNLTELMNDEDHIVDLELDDIGKAGASIERFGKLMEVLPNGIRVSMLKSSIPDLVNNLASQGVRISSVRSMRKLEDLFLRMTESAERMRISVSAPVQ